MRSARECDRTGGRVAQDRTARSNGDRAATARSSSGDKARSVQCGRQKITCSRSRDAKLHESPGIITINNN